MNIPFKALLLAAATTAAVSTSQAANGDLLAGFEHGSGNTFTYNIGPFTSLFDGETWNLGSQLIAAGFNASTPGANINFGVIGYQNSGSTLYSTVNPVDGSSDFNSARSQVQGMMTFAGAAQYNGGSQSQDWFTETESPFGFNSWFANTLENPNGSSAWGDGIVLRRNQLDNPGVISFGTFNLSGAGVLSYSAVPEPSTLGLIAGLGMLTLSFRRKSPKA